MTKQELPSVKKKTKKHNHHSISSHVFKEAARVPLKTTSAAVRSECRAQEQFHVK